MFFMLRKKKTIRKFIVDSYVHNWQIEKKSSFFFELVTGLKF